ncbi:hypothetical protein [Mycobacterium sp.]
MGFRLDFQLVIGAMTAWSSRWRCVLHGAGTPRSCGIRRVDGVNG